MKRRVTLVGLAVASMVIVPGHAQAAETVAATGPGAFSSTYATPVVTAQPGGTLRFFNLDIEKHNIVHDVEVDGSGGPDDSPWCTLFPTGPCPRFWSPLVTLGQSTTVSGLANTVAGGVYSFYCTQHPFMKGKLVVLPDA